MVEKVGQRLASVHNVRANARYSNQQHRMFRKIVLDRAGHRCQAIDNGKRCRVTERLQAHHLVRLQTQTNYDPNKGVALCPKHHAIAEKQARREQGADRKRKVEPHPGLGR